MLHKTPAACLVILLAIGCIIVSGKEKRPNRETQKENDSVSEEKHKELIKAITSLTKSNTKLVLKFLEHIDKNFVPVETPNPLEDDVKKALATTAATTAKLAPAVVRVNSTNLTTEKPKKAVTTKKPSNTTSTTPAPKEQPKKTKKK